MSAKQTLFERLMAVDPATANLSIFPAFNEADEKKVGELSDFHRRLIVLHAAVNSDFKKAIEMTETAVNAHDIYHDENPDAEHGGPLCKTAHEAVNKAEALDTEARLLADILKAVVSIDFPEDLAEGDTLGIRCDGSVITKALFESGGDAIMKVLADAIMNGRMTAVGIGRR
ncbi:MAG: hypothetical protein AB201_03165 [Parcubacteria bacterium C7867-006]|nr:MAG: hypothetical protein AB201_03165 [Parcubacteria bacterium C7867-006]